MTYPKIKPCPKCRQDSVDVWTYESGWSRTECSNPKCDHISSCEGRKLDAIRKHNAAYLAAAPVAHGTETCAVEAVKP